MMKTISKAAEQPVWQQVRPDEGNRDEAIRKTNQSRKISSASSRRPSSEEKSTKGSEVTHDSDPRSRQELIDLYTKIKEDAAKGTLHDIFKIFKF